MTFRYDYDPQKPVSDEDYDSLLHSVDLEVQSV